MNSVSPGLPISQHQLPLIKNLFSDPYKYHHANVGYFAILIKLGNAVCRQRSYPVRLMAQILPYLDPKYDTWISQGEFGKPNRRLVNLLQLSLSFLDLDIHKMPGYEDKGPEELLDIFLKFCIALNIPEPSLVLFSGRGLQSKWLYDKPIPRYALPRWNAAQRYLCNKLLPMGADVKAKDASRVLRLEHTVNTKSGEIVRILHDSGKVYNFDDFANAILPYTREEAEAYKKKCLEIEKIRASKNKPKARQHELSRPAFFQELQQKLNWDRLEDLRRLAQLRGEVFTGAKEGLRDSALLLSCSFLSHAVPDCNLSQEVTSLAQEFCPSFTYHEAQKFMSSVIKRHKEGQTYRWKNQTIIERLEITGDEEKQLKTIIGTTESKRRKAECQVKRRIALGGVDKNTYDLERKYRGDEKEYNINMLYQDGVPKAEIARRLDIPRSTVYYYLSRNAL